MSVRVFHRSSMQAGETITLDAAESHYLARVRRARAGASIEVLDGIALAFAAEVVVPDPSAAKVRIVGALEHASLPPIEIAIGIPDPSATLDALARACELGAARAVLVRCEHSHASEPGDSRTRRVLEASQRQCGRPDALGIEGPLPLATWLDRPSDTRSFVAVRGGATAVDAVGSEGGRVLVGPEGGLTERELEQAIACGFEAISLGPWTLRTEVAVVAALSRVLHRSGPEHGRRQGHGA